jgi:EpsD family peptidyl-prolyl cis-trans isomerase
MTPPLFSTRKTALVAGLALTAACLTACDREEGKEAPTQIAAKVGADEISMHQVNQVLSHTNTTGATPEQVRALSRDVLEKLIDQQLAIEQAKQRKLHRAPEVVADIEAASREILARAYLQQMVADIPKPTADETHAYYLEHPKLFAERRIFNVQEVLAPADAGTLEQMRSMAAANKTVDDVAAWLKAKDIRFSGGNVMRPAEQMPLDALDKVYALKPGQSLVLDSAQGVTFLRLIGSQAAPVSEDAASQPIQRYLANQRSGDAINAAMAQLRSATKITYLGEFDKSKPAPEPGAGLLK